jgi:membrane associated rhomboid family serine protease
MPEPVPAQPDDSNVAPNSGRRRPPPLGSFPKYPVVASICAAAVLVSIASVAGWHHDPVLMDARAWDGQFWRLASSALVHIGPLHLIFNLYWLWAFGTALEESLGARAIGGIVLLLAVGSQAAEYALSIPGVGLSGVGYGLFGLLLVLGRWDVRFARIVDRQTTALFVIWFVVCWLMTQAGHWNIGNVAHAAGTFIGVLLGLILVTHGRWRVALSGLLAVFTALALVGAMVRTPDASELAYLSYFDLENGRNDRAADRLQRAVELDPKQVDWWVNLGIARERLGRMEAAIEAFRKARDLRPMDPEGRARLAWALSEGGYRKHIAGNLAKACALYRESLALDERSAHVWHNLGLAEMELGHHEEAQAAFRSAIELDPLNQTFRSSLDATHAAGERAK